MAHVQPDEERDRHGEVRVEVVGVEELDEADAVEREALHGLLVEHAERPLDVDDLCGRWRARRRRRLRRRDGPPCRRARRRAQIRISSRRGPPSRERHQRRSRAALGLRGGVVGAEAGPGAIPPVRSGPSTGITSLPERPRIHPLPRTIGPHHFAKSAPVVGNSLVGDRFRPTAGCGFRPRCARFDGGSCPSRGVGRRTLATLRRGQHPYPIDRRRRRASPARDRRRGAASRAPCS